MKPKYLEAKYAEIFKQKNVAEAYIYRPPYPRQIFEILYNLIPKIELKIIGKE